MWTVARPSKPGTDVLLVGEGATAVCVAAALLGQGHELTVLTRDAVVADAINARGLRCVGEQSSEFVRCAAGTSICRGARYGLLLLAASRRHAARQLQQALPHLTDDAVVVSFVRGLFEPELHRRGAPDIALGAVASWGASLREPAVADRTAAGGLVLGPVGGLDHPGWSCAPAPQPQQLPSEQRGSTEEAGQEPPSTGAPSFAAASVEKLRSTARLLEAVAPVTVTDNLLGARWCQIAWESVVEPLGFLAGTRVGEIARHPFALQLALEALTEAIEVAQAAKVKLEGLPGTPDLTPLALSSEQRDPAVPTAGLLEKRAWLGAVAGRYGRVRSRLLAAAEQGAPVVPRANDHISAMGENLGVGTPRQRGLAAAVRRRVETRAEPGLHLLQQACAQGGDCPSGAQGSTEERDELPPPSAP
jgi:ketopantoate reductase